MSQNQVPKKYSYYISFDTSIFLSAKELLKSMPTFYNKVYFSIKYARAIWSGDKEETFTNVTLLAKSEEMDILRQIIKNNFLYINEWDSTRYTTKADYGFSFIGGNVKFVLMPFDEMENGYYVRSYDVDTGNCYDTTITCDKRYFLSTSMNDTGEFIRICDFNLEYMTDANTKVERAPKKAEQQQMVTFIPNGGYAFINLIAIMLLTLVSVATVYLSYYIVSSGLS